MAQNIYQKTPSEVRQYSIFLNLALQTGETITTVTPATKVPASSAIVLSGVALDSTNAYLKFGVSGGTAGTSTRLTWLLTTSLGNIFSVSASVVVSTDSIDQYTNFNPDAFSTLIDKVKAGDNANSVTNFILPSGTHIDQSLSCVWEVLDAEGTIYSSGESLEIKSSYTSNGDVKLQVFSVILVPSTVPATLVGTRYQIRYSLANGDQSYFNSENFSVYAEYSVPTGPASVIETAGNTAAANIVIDKPYNHVAYEVFDDSNNRLLALTEITGSGLPTSDGYHYKASINTTGFKPSLVPYIVIWHYWNEDSDRQTDSAHLFLTNASIISAMTDMRTFLNRSRTNLDQLPETALTPLAIMAYLRMGMDAFNLLEQPTNFVMTAASAGIRDGWLTCSKIQACRSTYISLGGHGYSFNFAGSEVSFDLDIPPYWDSLASALEGQLDNIKQFKRQLVSRGLNGGDGNLNGGALKRRVGGISMSYSPVSTIMRPSRGLILGR